MGLIYKLISLSILLQGSLCANNLVDFTEDLIYVPPWQNVLLGVSSDQLTDKEKIQIWHAKTAMNAALHINCSSNLIESPGCSSSSLTIHVNGYPHGSSICGQNDNLQVGYANNDITIILKLSLQGRNSQEWMACNLVSHIKAPGNSHVTNPPQENYRLVNFVETDSTEHGVDAVTSKTTSCPCGRKNKQMGRIVGGRQYWPHKYPFIAGIVYSLNLAPFCGGAIITPNFVLTAAHCTDDIIKKNISISITAGDHLRDVNHINMNQQIRVVMLIKQHSEYMGPPTYENDISLLVLQQPLMFNQFVSPVCLPDPNLDVVGREATIIGTTICDMLMYICSLNHFIVGGYDGWGAQIGQGPMTALPAYVKVQVIDRLSCSTDWELVSYQKPSQICTYGFQKSSCQGDSGGPVVWLDPDTNRYTLVGLVSFGVSTCTNEKAAVHTDVAKFMHSIAGLIREISPNEQLCGKI